MEEPTINALHTLTSMEPVPTDFHHEDCKTTIASSRGFNDTGGGSSSEEEVDEEAMELDGYLKLCQSQAEFDRMDALSQRGLLVRSYNALNPSENTKHGILHFAGKHLLLSKVASRRKHIASLRNLLVEVDSVRSSLQDGPVRRHLDLLAGIRSTDGMNRRAIPGNHHNIAIRDSLKKQKVEASDSMRYNHAINQAKRKKELEAWRQREAVVKQVRHSDRVPDKFLTHVELTGNYDARRNISNSRTFANRIEISSLLVNKSELEARSTFSLLRAVNCRQAIARGCLKLQGERLKHAALSYECDEKKKGNLSEKCKRVPRS